MGATGQMVFAYTWQLGGGFSASLSAEDGGASAAGAGGANSRSRSKITVDLDQNPFALGAVVTDNGSYAMPDLVGNVRVDQAWGSAMLKAALHQNRGGYYNAFPLGGAGIGTCTGNPDTTNCGHPEDKIGWAVGAGFAWNNVWAPGSSISAEAHYGQGAVGYTMRGFSWRMWGDGRSIGLGNITDSVFRNGTGLELTESWSVLAAAEHRWNPQWRTSIYGGYVEVNYSGTAEDMICGRGAFGPGFVGAAGQRLAGIVVANCSPDTSFWAVGSRTQWNPHPFLDIGLDVNFHRHNTAHAGLAVTAADGARPAGPVVVEDQDIWTAMFRVQYNMLP
jgi:hypothetical protein